MDTVTVSKIVQILFTHAPSKSHTICKVHMKSLNWKMQKLQKEGMTILGLYFEELKEFKQIGALTGRLSGKSPSDGSEIPTQNNGEISTCLEK